MITGGVGFHTRSKVDVMFVKFVQTSKESNQAVGTAHESVVGRHVAGMD